MNRLTIVLPVAAAVLCGATLIRGRAADETRPAARFTGDREMARPEGYREWIWVSSGLDMSYSAPREEAERQSVFTNVYVAPAAYRSFVRTGAWPNGTVFALEVRAAESAGSINKAGHYQGELLALEASVKDERRFGEKWAYFGFGKDRKTATPFPKEACWSCHHEHGARDNTFLQFYPGLREAAGIKLDAGNHGSQAPK